MLRPVFFLFFAALSAASLVWESIVGAFDMVQDAVFSFPLLAHVSDMQASTFQEINEEVSIIIISGNGRLHEYISSFTATKQMIDLYQKTQGIDLWSPHYERMEQRLKELKETNTSLKNQISVMQGESLGNLSFHELFTFELEMEGALDALREHRYFVMRAQLDRTKKKLKFLETRYLALRIGFAVAMDDPDYGVVDNRGVYDYGLTRAFASGQNLNQPTEVTEAESVLTTCSDISDCGVNQPNLDDETDSAKS